MKKVLFSLALGTLVALAGCVTVPVQAMSNARQALQAATRAGAQRYAPALYAEAEHWLDDASFALKSNNYERARHSAQLATQAARQATAKARALRAAQPSTAPAPATADPHGGPETR
jgi:hypothetical protein